MKILGGNLKGHNFYMPHGIRPTQNLIKKAVFDILGDIAGLDFLELFAGSGAIGFEAFSRGAKAVTIIESDAFCQEVIEKNMELLRISSQGKFTSEFMSLGGEVFATLKSLSLKKKKFDIAFADPPYGRELGKKALKALNAYDILRPNCLVIIQVEKNEILPSAEGRFLLVRQKRYGTSQLSVYEGKDPSDT